MARPTPNYPISMRYQRIVAAVSVLLMLTSSAKANNTRGIDTLVVTHPVERFSLVITNTFHSIYLQNLDVGEEYRLFVNTPKADRQINFLSNGTRVFTFRAQSEQQEVILETDQTESLEAVLSVGCVSCPRADARSLMGIMTDQNYSAQSLIQDVFIAGDCFDVDPASITFSGDNRGKGYFSNGGNAIDIETGVILSSGTISNSEGPNQNYNTGTSFPIFDVDPDLVDIVGTSSIYDASALEFDFTPTTDQVSFEFVFASEEYCEYVNSSFNDVFGFFISGPGINGPFANGAANIALVPGSSDFIAINSVNHLQNQAYYVNNIPTWQHDIIPAFIACNNYPENTNGVAINDIEFDGFTTVMTALANVQACETYHIKLIVADVSDGYYDSAVFLKANSFAAGTTAQLSAEAPGETAPTNTAYEGCLDAQLIFSRSGEDLSEPLVVHYDLGVGSTALPGIDYLALPDSVIIPAGDSVLYVPVEVLADGLTEGPESIILELEAACSCELSVAELWIEDAAPLSITADSLFFCDPTTLSFEPTVSGGIGTYQYAWNTGDDTPTLTVPVDASATYTVTVTDFCGNTIVGVNMVEVVEVPTATLSGDVLVCPENPSASLQIDLTGQGPWVIEYSLDATLQPPVEVNSSPFILDANAIGTYQLVSVMTNGCIGDAQGIGTVTPTNWAVNYTIDEETCPGASDGAIQVSAAGATAPYTYQWSDGLPSINNPVGLNNALYQLTITDDAGCTYSTPILVPLNVDVPTAEAGQNQQLNCEQTEVNLQGEASIGPTISYSWTTTDGLILADAASLNPLVGQNGTYTLAVTNETTGCAVYDAVQVTVDTVAPIAQIILNGLQELNCQQTSTLLEAAGPPSPDLELLWATDNGSIMPGPIDGYSIEVQSSGIYTFTVLDPTNGCTATDEITITSSQDLPNIFIQPPAILTCIDSIIQLDANGSSTGADLVYNWSTDDGGLIVNPTSLNPSVDQPGVYTLTIYNTSNNCENTASRTVLEDRIPPIAEAGLEAELDCNTLRAALDGTGSSLGSNYVYQWQTNNGQIIGNGETLLTEVGSVGWYELWVKNIINGCTSKDGVQVTERTNVPTDLVAAASPPDCPEEGGTILIESVDGGEGPLLFSLDGGENFYLDTFFLALNPGAYEIMVQDAGGCQYAEQLVIPNVLGPEVSILEPEVALNIGENYQILTEVNLLPEQIDTIIWSPATNLSCADCLEPEVIPSESMLYTLTVINQNGCAAQAELQLRVDKDRAVFIPNVFSPNADGTNDVLFINAKQGVVNQIRSFRIFNRWGGLVFESVGGQPNDPGFGWNGFLRGQLLNPAVFIYIADIEFTDGARIQYTGDVTLTE